jgi:hypothetical protein
MQWTGKRGSPSTGYPSLPGLAECTLTPERWSEIEEALQLIKTLSDELANQLNCMAEKAGVAWTENNYAGL